MPSKHLEDSIVLAGLNGSKMQKKVESFKKLIVKY